MPFNAVDIYNLGESYAEGHLGVSLFLTYISMRLIPPRLARLHKWFVFICLFLREKRGACE